ncbi:MAG: septum formation initiator family protein [Cyclobacteriaceae bacterium]|nr:septum formation initiator family protein [Cyclobacteriaceae bacterium]
MKIPRIFKNFYFITGFLFLIWMLFIDSTDIISQFKLKNQLNSLEKQKSYYEEQIDLIETDYENRVNNPEQLERFAREQYYMKKESEELFVIVKEK